MKIRRVVSGVLSVLLLLGVSAMLSACQMVVMDPMGVIAADEKRLLVTAVLLMLIIVLPVIILTFVIARRYRASNTRATYRPDFTHSVWLEAVWWAIPIIIIAILATITWKSTHKLDPYRPLESPVKPLTIQVIALPWRWLFIYPDQNIATLNEVTFPAHTPINFLITADAPMNSFQIQQLGGQIYAMSGMQTKLHLMADEVRDYDGRSVSFSGEGFTDMTFIAHAIAPKDFDAWVEKIKGSPMKLSIDRYNELVRASRDHHVLQFSEVDAGLFNTIMMKYMMPMPNMKPIENHTLTPEESAGKTYRSRRNHSQSFRFKGEKHA